MTDLDSAINSLPPPHCPEDLGAHCPGPFERITATCRPGEIDVCVRCTECQAQAAYSIDQATGQILEGEALLLLRANSGLTVSPTTEEVGSG